MFARECTRWLEDPENQADVDLARLRLQQKVANQKLQMVAMTNSTTDGLDLTSSQQEERNAQHTMT
ncbi:hypothetical protein BGZ80_005024, partial [Entomortierella chlamydospora]